MSVSIPTCLSVLSISFCLCLPRDCLSACSFIHFIFPYQSKSGEQPGSTSVEEAKLEKEKYTSIVKELKIIGLEVVEENEELFILLTERDNLKKWIEEKSDGNITIVIKGTTLEDKATETEVIVTQKEDYEQTEGKRKRVEAEVIILRQKIEDQAQELNRFYKVFKEVMTQNKVLREKEQGKEIEGGNARSKGLCLYFIITNRSIRYSLHLVLFDQEVLVNIAIVCYIFKVIL